jgi:hypothetical protein
VPGIGAPARFLRDSRDLAVAVRYRGQVEPTHASEPRSIGRAALWIGVAAIATIVGRVLTLPGVDGEVLSAGGLLDASVLAVLGPQLVLVVAARLALDAAGKRGSRIARTLTLAIVLVLCAIQTFALAVWAEQAGDELPYVKLVLEPGLRFRLVATLTATTAAAIAYWLADRIDASRLATGALVLAFFAAPLESLRPAFDPIATPHALALPVALALAMLIVAIGLVVRAPASWPVRVLGGLELRSAFDALAVPSAIALLSSVSLGPLAIPLIGRPLLVLAGTIALLVLLSRRSEKGARVLWPLAIAVPFVLVALGVSSLGLVRSGALERALDPGPLRGDASFELTLEAVDRFHDGEAEAMVARLEMLGAGAELVSADPRRITLRVRNARDLDSVLEALRPHRLGLHWVEAPPSVEPPPGVSAPTEYRPSFEGACDVVRPWSVTVPCTAAIQAVHDPTSAASVCHLYCLAREPIVVTRDVRDAEVVIDPYTQQPLVSATLRDEAAERFGRETGANIGRHLAIVLDDEVVSAPVVQTAIPGGRLQITLGSSEGATDRLAEAQLLVAALRSGDSLTSAWLLQSIER